MRIKYLDIAKGIGILLMVLGHCYNGGALKSWIYSFHMPLFFIISGMLLKCKNEVNKSSIRVFTLKKISQNLRPYLLFCMISLIPILLESYLKNNIKNTVIEYFFRIILGLGVNALWFIPALIIAEILFFVMNKKLNKKISVIMTIILFIMPYLFTLTNIETTQNIVLVILRSFIGLGFLSIGYYSFEILNKKDVKIGDIVFYFMFTILFTYLNGKVELWNLEFNNFILYILSSIVGSIFVLFISKKINNNSTLEYFGKNTISILGVQYITIQFIFKLGSKIVGYWDRVELIPGLIAFIVTMTFILIEVVIIKKYMPFIIGNRLIQNHD